MGQGIQIKNFEANVFQKNNIFTSFPDNFLAFLRTIRP
jgi:hypothetical protein